MEVVLQVAQEGVQVIQDLLLVQEVLEIQEPPLAQKLVNQVAQYLQIIAANLARWELQHKQQVLLQEQVHHQNQLQLHPHLHLMVNLHKQPQQLLQARLLQQQLQGMEGKALWGKALEANPQLMQVTLLLVQALHLVLVLLQVQVLRLQVV